MAKAYKIKASDSALTVPGRTTFPRGTYVTQPVRLPTANYYNSERYRTPYAQGVGTQASGLSGSQGAPFAMAPTTFGASPNPLGRTNTAGGVGSTPYGPPAPVSYGPPAPVAGGPAQQWINQQHSSPLSGYGTDDSWWRPAAPAAPVMAQTPALQPGQYVDTQGQVQKGAAPFGTNAYGERLDAGGNVWDPATATSDIYGGRFIQAGEVKWERNRAGRLVKVKYEKGGTKRVIAGGKGQAKRRQSQAEAAAQPAAAQPVQQAVQQPSIANAFVSFRS